MINSRTVLVLGAGASAPYGFPLGRNLLLEIGRELYSGSVNPYQNILMECGFSIDDLRRFAVELLNSMQPSVDAFLENRPEYMQIGKHAIAAKLIPLELEERLIRREKKNGGLDWYEYLFNQLGARKDDFNKNRISIITFNYDRSLEYFLFVALKFSYGISMTEAAKLVSDIPIVHVYGQLGQLDFIGPDGRSYLPNMNPEIIRRCASEISIIHESTATTPAILQAQEIIAQTETMCFLGFGYHELNIQRLGVNSLFKANRFWGTAYGLKNAEREKIRSLFDKKIELGSDSDDVLLFIRQYPVFVG
jgi:hypothetical protein